MNLSPLASAPQVDSTQPKRYPWIAATFILSSALAACAIVAWQLIVLGPFAWHISITPTVHGGIEAVFLLGLLALAQCLNDTRWRNSVCLVLGLIYLRRHAVDLPLLVDLIYFEITIALGALVARMTGSDRPQTSDDFLRCFVLGFVVWSVAAWTMSAFGFGSPSALRTVTLILGVPALSARSKPLVAHLISRGSELSLPARALAAALAGWILVLFARTNVVAGYDSLWYGLRGQYVLAGDGSAFAPLGLISPAHYVPKLFDVYLLPMSGLGDNSVIVGVTIGTLVLLALIVTRLMARLGVDEPIAQLCAAALCISLPAISNTALESKPDIIAALFVMLAWMASADWLRTRRYAALGWFAATALLATQAKLTTIPYVVFMTMGVALATWLTKTRVISTTAHGALESSRTSAAVLALAAATACFVSARTLLLTGVPTIGPDQLSAVWSALGFHLKEPAGTYATWTLPQVWSDVPALILDWLFRPQRMEHIVITWVGNAWLWLPLIAQFGQARHVRSNALDRTYRLVGIALVTTGIILALAWRYLSRGSDGNYFIAALVPAIVLGTAYAVRRLAPTRRLYHAMVGGILAISLFQAGYAFISGGWSPGTRAFDMNLGRSVRDTRASTTKMFEDAGVANIAEYLRVLPGTPRVIGCAGYESSTRLPARYEGLELIANVRPEVIAEAQVLRTYMRDFHIPYLVLPRQDAKPSKDPNLLDAALCRPGWWNPGEATVVVNDKSYTLYYFSFDH